MAASTGIRVIPFTASIGGLMPNEITFAKLAQQRGYSTALIGKCDRRVIHNPYG